MTSRTVGPPTTPHPWTPPSLGVRLARRLYVAEVRRAGARAARPAAPSAQGIADLVVALDPTLGSRASVADEIDAILTRATAAGAPSRLVRALSLALGVSSSYLLDPRHADQEDCAGISRTLTRVGAKSVRICRTLGEPNVPDVLLQVLEAVVDEVEAVG